MLPSRAGFLGRCLHLARRPEPLVASYRRSLSTSSFVAAAAAATGGPTVRRALMYVPGSDERKLAKIPQLGADCVCLDCEDGVAITKKEEARSNIRKLLDEQSIDFGPSECTVRVNSVDSGLCLADLQTVLGGPNLPQALHLPKTDNPEHLRWFVRKYNDARTSSGHERPEGQRMGLIIFVESASALMRLPQICEAAQELKMMSNLVPEALVFGSDDYVADIGAERTPEATELLYARQKVVAVAKAFGMQAIDLVHIDYKDLDGLKLYSEQGARMGFTGKQVIHPGQIPVVQKAFSPSLQKLEWATELIKEFRQHEQSGKGAFSFRGSMIDMPLVKQAEYIVAMKEKV